MEKQIFPDLQNLYPGVFWGAEADFEGPGSPRGPGGAQEAPAELGRGGSPDHTPAAVDHPFGGTALLGPLVQGRSSPKAEWLIGPL